MTAAAAPISAVAGSSLRVGVVFPLLFGVAVVGTQMFVVSPLLPDIAQGLGVSVQQVGLAVSLGSLATALTAAFAVPVIDGIPRKALLIGVLLDMAAALTMVAVAPNYWVFALATAAAGALSGLLLPTTYAMAGDLAAEHERGRLLGWVLLGWSISFFLQPLAGYVGDHLGWRGAYAGLAAVALLGALLDAALPFRQATGAHITLKAYGEALAIPAVVPLLLAVVLFMFGFYGVYPYWGAAYRALNGGDATSASWLGVAYGSGFALASTFSGRLIERLTSWRVLVLVLGVISVCYALLPVALAHGPFLFLWCAALGCCNNIGLNAMVGSCASLSVERRGSVLAIYAATTYVGFTLGAAMLGAVFQLYGLWLNGLVASGAMAVALVFALIAMRARRRSVEQRRD